jgi:hypothetical protein
MGVEIELWDIMRSISNWKTLMLILSVRGYQSEMMLVCNYMMIMHRNV